MGIAHYEYGSMYDLDPFISHWPVPLDMVVEMIDVWLQGSEP